MSGSRATKNRIFLYAALVAIGQRNKIMEKAPSPRRSASTRTEMAAAAAPLVDTPDARRGFIDFAVFV